MLNKLLKNTPLILDGAMGTLIFEALPNYNSNMELLNVNKPDIIKSIHTQYIEAGANIIETNSFGGSKLKLAEYGLEDQCYELNKKSVEIAHECTKNFNDRQIFVAGSIGPTGALIEPLGDTTFEHVFNAFKEQALGLSDGGCHLIIIETMNDLQEAKAALFAVKEVCNLPVICNMTFDENGKTIGGTDIITAFATLKQHGADIVGTNCGLGPEQISSLIKEKLPLIRELGCPIAVWANAGLPQVIDGKTVYLQDPKTFSENCKPLFDAGIEIIGGCCGTTPEHINKLCNVSLNYTYNEQSYHKEYLYATSLLSSKKISSNSFVKIGERLNPTARKAFAAELKEHKTFFLRKESVLQEKEGADILDINVGVPNIDELRTMTKSVTTLSTITSLPLMIDSDNPKVLEAAVRLYPGICILNSINGKRESLDRITPIAQKYGCFILALCLDETGIHTSSEKRIEIGDKIIDYLSEKGIHKSRIIIDPLMLTESAEPGSASETLKVVSYFSQKDIKTSLGLSNISFGLPQRKFINNTYLKLAIENGLSMAILNTRTLNLINEFCEEEKLALNFLTGKDPNATNYISYFNNLATDKPKVEINQTIKEQSPLEHLKELVINGDSDNIQDEINDTLKNNISPELIMNESLLSGLEIVGNYYSDGKYFLPQMIASANAMKKGFELLKPLLKKDSTSSQGTIVICTVKGDIHDIGKNIVAMMFENHGFEVYDLGKDIENQVIYDKAIEVNADIVCLSSLLTTTMPQMQEFSELSSINSAPYKIMVGGAVVTSEYAESIGVHYSEDSVEAVKVAKMLISDI